MKQVKSLFICTNSFLIFNLKLHADHSLETVILSLAACINTEAAFTRVYFIQQQILQSAQVWTNRNIAAYLSHRTGHIRTSWKTGEYSTIQESLFCRKCSHADSAISFVWCAPHKYYGFPLFKKSCMKPWQG